MGYKINCAMFAFKIEFEYPDNSDDEIDAIALMGKIDSVLIILQKICCQLWMEDKHYYIILKER